MIKSLLCLCFATVFLSAEMTLEEKVGQLLIVHFPGKVINEDARVLVQEIGVGGIIYYVWANGLGSSQQVQSLSQGLQSLASIPLFISIDQEGGRVTRLKSGFTVFPSNGILGRSGYPQLAETAAFTMGQEMRAVGINLNFAPVVDVNCNPDNPVIGDRSFGACPKSVTEYGRRALEGYARAKVFAALKHFPGHGDATADSHVSLPLVQKTREELMAVELYPFQKLAPFADMIMTAHILVPALDPDNCSTFSSKILKELLRSEFGFQGIVISDSLVMEGVLSQGISVEQAALRALQAGCDMLILGGRELVGQRMHHELTIQDVKKIHRYLVDAVKQGSFSEADLDASVQRILRLKSKI
jgi:beta-N-acetylhexosaminidase